MFVAHIKWKSDSDIHNTVLHLESNDQHNAKEEVFNLLGIGQPNQVPYYEYEPDMVILYEVKDSYRLDIDSQIDMITRQEAQIEAERELKLEAEAFERARSKKKR